ncbi:MAG TPA: hypothetical protein VHX36_04245 [Candidatus Acidoferrales bacterium]|nr:hypothetical protein [Candidatus Acidoferrales bacterium]
MRDHQGQAAATGKATDDSIKTKRPYSKPSFREEHAFETMALRCGKLSPTEQNCGTIKNS